MWTRCARSFSATGIEPAPRSSTDHLASRGASTMPRPSHRRPQPRRSRPSCGFSAKTAIKLNSDCDLSDPNLSQSYCTYGGYCACPSSSSNKHLGRNAHYQFVVENRRRAARVVRLASLGRIAACRASTTRRRRTATAVRLLLFLARWSNRRAGV